MSLIQRITTSLRANIEQAVDQIENQDALIEAAIGEMRQANARARARLGRVQRDRQTLQSRRDELQQAAEQWRQRALRSAADETTALACLQRHNRCTEQCQQLEQDLAQQRLEEDRLRARLEQNERRIGQLSQRRHLLRTRESSLQAERLMQPRQDGPIDVESVFERWEGRLIEAEPVSASCSPLDSDLGVEFGPEFGPEAGVAAADPLAQRFAREEQDKALRRQLQVLLSKEQGDE
ncbi:PspA/IM30 family protein [Magnetovirga frankeli]|uniref:PspA/IM30 family protein n=1 Tax=Magnetovirga frankeli TaxID=947516 RepID=UPI001293AC80|nr:PspA/IM30 family protein [gamma proteobacterium SS-5]